MSLRGLRIGCVLLSLGGCWALLAAPARADDPAGMRKVASVEGITEYRLDNGLRLLLVPDNSRPSITINLTVLVGSRHEGYGESGMAHLLEHMLFKGTPTHANIPQELQQRGASFNGSTNNDRTNYFETLPAGDANLEWALRMEADRLVNSFVRREDLASEMTVVRNEFERGENSPGGVLDDKMLAAAYQWHNYGKTTIGNRSDIERVPIENLQAFYRKFYQPDNVVVIVGGRFDPAKALALAADSFGKIPRPTRKLDATYTEEPAQDGEREVILRRVGKGGIVGLMYHVPAGSDPEFPALDVLAATLTAPTGWLYRELVESGKATRVSGSAGAWHDPGIIQFTAEPAPGTSLAELRDLLIRGVEAAGERGVTDAEVERARREFRTRRERAAANTNQLAVRLSEWVAQGDWRLYFLYRDRFENVTAADVKAVAAKYLRRANRTVGLYLPTENPERVVVAPAPNLEAAVRNYAGRAVAAEAELFDYSPASVAARVQRATLPGGIQAFLLPKKTRGEMVELQLTLRYGDLQSLQGLRGAASMLGALMNRGTRRRSYQELRDELGRLNATLTVGGFGGFGGRGGGRGGGSSLGELPVSLSCPRANLSAALELMREVLREPALSAQEFDRIKQAQVAGLDRGRGEPQTMASNWLARALSPYPAGDERYVATPEEQAARLQAVTLDQVKRVYEEFLGAQAGELVVIGDFDPDEALKGAAAVLDGWKAAHPYARIDATSRQAPAAREAINTPDKANAVYLAALVIPMRDNDPDYPAMVIADTILGGGTLSSRLGDRIRQKEGLSYGVTSSFSASPFHNGATLRMTAICNPENIGRVEKAVREELERLVRDGVTQEELDRVRGGYLQARAQARATDQALVRRLGALAEAGRPVTYDADFEAKIRALTPQQILAALRRHVDPKQLVVVVAGDFKAAP
jgi:zinc protease